LFCVGVPARPLPSTGRAVGVDLGVTVAVALSNGRLIPNPRHFARSAEALARAQRVLARKKRGSRRRVKAAAAVVAVSRRVANQRRDFLHKQSRALVNEHDVIAVEDLPITNMTRRPNPVAEDSGGFAPNGATAKAGLNKSILDVGR